MSNHPYKTAASYTKWFRAVSSVPQADVDLGFDFPFKIGKNDVVATAGSCFAQHIARELKSSGFNFLVAEKPHPFIAEVANKHGYGLFSARYGNIYTSRQFLQLIQRAMNLFEPRERVWFGEDKNYYDPYRPTIHPGGYISKEELEADRAQHLKAVLAMLRELDYLVFTLGLTECWISSLDGAAFPLCPGVAAGNYDPEVHAFVNLTVEDVVADMTAAFRLLKSVNPTARMILTVSPVALAATAVDRHVLVSNTLSKSILRVAADTLARSHDDIAYFPSFETILGAHSRGSYVRDDLREVNEAGVSHVMRLFKHHATVANDEQDVRPVVAEEPSDETSFASDFASAMQVECDEILLAR